MYTTLRGNKRSINRIATFEAALGSQSVLSLQSFDPIFDKAEALVRGEHPRVKQEALNNSRGDWYESLIVLGCLEYALTRKPRYQMIRLPNVSTFSCDKLYNKEITDLIEEFRKQLKKGPDVRIVSSNPDFVIVNSRTLKNGQVPNPIPQKLDYLSSLYKKVSGRCSFEDINGYSSVKTSLRPDRRLQICHEGSVMKALYRHIQTRLWRIDAPGVKYYGITQERSAPDLEALKTVATHSILDVAGTPESAVDQLFQVNSGPSLIATLDRILS